MTKDISIMKISSDTSPSNELKLFSEEWIDLQTWFVQVLKLPADELSFRERYGSFEDKQGVQEFVAALSDAQQIARIFGHPSQIQQILATDGGALTSATPPDLIYGHLIWLMSQIQNASTSTVSYLSDLKTILDTSIGDDTARAEASKALLCGSGGFLSIVNDTMEKIQSLVSKIFGYQSRLAGSIQVFNETNLVNEANQMIGGLTTKIERLKEQADSVSDSQGGKSFFAWWIPNSKKEKARKEYEELMAEIGDDQADIQQKALFIADLKGFFVAGNEVVPAIQAIDSALGKLDKTFDNWGNTVSSTCELANDQQLGSITWLSQALDVTTVTQTFQTLANEASEFISHSLVSFD